MDTVDFKFNQSIFSNLKSQKARYWWNQSEGWKNKYKDRDPSKGPAFPGSTTIFVWLTDAWHFFQMIMLTSFQSAILIGFFVCQPIVWWIFIFAILLMKMIGGFVFEIFWRYLWKKK